MAVRVYKLMTNIKKVEIEEDGRFKINSRLIAMHQCKSVQLLGGFGSEC
jgi:hypothetical protein